MTAREDGVGPGELFRRLRIGLCPACGQPGLHVVGDRFECPNEPPLRVDEVKRVEVVDEVELPVEVVDVVGPFVTGRVFTDEDIERLVAEAVEDLIAPEAERVVHCMGKLADGRRCFKPLPCPTHSQATVVDPPDYVTCPVCGQQIIVAPSEWDHRDPPGDWSVTLRCDVCRVRSTITLWASGRDPSSPT